MDIRTIFIMHMVKSYIKKYTTLIFVEQKLQISTKRKEDGGRMEEDELEIMVGKG